MSTILQALEEAENEPLSEQWERDRLKEKALNRRGLGSAQGIGNKMINGCGSDRYLRYWFGKTHKSVYLGRVE